MPSGRPFDSLDAFDRLRWNKWEQPVILGTDTVLLDYEVGYDKLHNLLFKEDHLAGADRDHLSTFDRLNRQARHARGTLNSTRTTILPTASKLEEIWGLDQSANWRSVDQAAGTNPPGFQQTRQHSPADRIASLATPTGTSWPSPVHDAVGLMTEMPRPLNLGSRYDVRYDGWGRLTDLSFVPTDTDTAEDYHRFEYDGLGRRIVSRSNKGGAYEVRHFYYDESGRIITEGVEQLVPVEGVTQLQTVLDREFIWDVNDPGRLLCRVRHINPAAGVQERHYPLYDARGDVVALLNPSGDVVERFDYDGLGNVVYLNADFTIKPVQQSSFDWEILLGGLRRDRWNGLYAAGAAWLHPALGRLLPSGPVLVIPEHELTDFVSDFPLGNWRQPLTTRGLYLQSAERAIKWLNDQSPWVKVTVGAGALLVTAVIVGANLENPYGYVMLAGAVAGGIQGGVEAGLSKGDWSDVILQAGLGSLFGAIAPWGAFGSLGGSLVAGGGTLALGGDQNAIATAWASGGLIGGIAGDFGGAFRGAVKSGYGFKRALASGLWQAGPDLLGAGAGAAYGGMTEGTSTAALHYANLGMFAGGIGLRAGSWGAQAGVRALNRGGSGFAMRTARPWTRLGILQLPSNSGAARGRGRAIALRGGQPASNRRLIHLTDEAGRTGIDTSGQLIGRHGIFAVPEEVATETTLLRVLRTGLPASRTRNVIALPASATRHFRRPLPMGPYSTWKYLGGVHYAPAGVLNISNGTISTLPTFVGPAFLIYGPDAVFYLGAGTAVGLYLYSSQQ